MFICLALVKLIVSELQVYIGLFLSITVPLSADKVNQHAPTCLLLYKLIIVFNKAFNNQSLVTSYFSSFQARTI